MNLAMMRLNLAAAFVWLVTAKIMSRRRQRAGGAYWVAALHAIAASLCVVAIAAEAVT
jgi:hypothetical protein